MIQLILTVHTSAFPIIEFKVWTFHFGYKVVEKFNIVNSTPQVGEVSTVGGDGFQVVIYQFEGEDGEVNHIPESQQDFGEFVSVNFVFNFRDVSVDVKG